MKRLLLLVSLFLIQSVLYPVIAQVKQKVVINSKTSTYHIVFPKDSTSTSIDAYMLGLAHPVTFYIKLKKGKKLTATINEMADPGNIRINQIILPDGSSGGPFGKSMEFPVKRSGTYKLIVGGSNMQGDDWKGAFTLHVATSKY